MKLKVKLPVVRLPAVRLTPGLLVLAIFALGLVAFAWGLWMAWPPLGPIGAGLVLMSWCVFGEAKPS